MTRSANLAEQLAAARVLISACRQGEAYEAGTPEPELSALAAMNAIRRILFACVEAAPDEASAHMAIACITVDLGAHAAINLNALPDTIRPAVISDFFTTIAATTKGWRIETTQSFEPVATASVH